MTNLDKLRQMNAKELGVFLEDCIGSPAWCKPSHVEVDPLTKMCKKWDCYKCAQEWLEAEATE